MKRDLSLIEELPNGWWNFEYLDQEAERFTELLERYKLQVQYGSSQVWVATLLPYDSEHSVVPKVRTLGPIKALLLKLLPSRAKTKMLADYIFRESLREHEEQLLLQRGIEDRCIDGYYCALTGPHVQDCLEKLLTNVENGERYTYHNAYKGPSGSKVMGCALAYETDTMGQYLMKGKLSGSRNEGQVILKANHPTLSEFSIRDPSFREAYSKLVDNMKKKLTSKQLYEAAR